MYTYIFIEELMSYFYQITIGRKFGKQLHKEHWTAVSALLGRISSAYRHLHHWRSNQKQQIADAETLPLGHRSTSNASDAKLTSHGEMRDHLT